MKRYITAGICAAMGLLGASACANPSDGSDQAVGGNKDLVAEVTKDDAIAAKLPEQIRQKGGFTASINPEVAPIKFVDSNGKIQGLNPDLLRAAAKVLDTQVTFQKGTFDAMVPGLESKRYDVIASMGDFVERQKKIDFIDYLLTGTAILVSKDFNKDKLTPSELCGMTVGYTRGNAQQGMVEAADKRCKDAGKPAVKMNPYQDAGAGVLSVKSGQADAYWGDTPAMNYNVKQQPTTFKIVFSEKSVVYGIGVHKDNTKLRDALREALLKLVGTGVYDALLKKWGQDGFAIPDMHINSDIKLEG